MVENIETCQRVKQYNRLFEYEKKIFKTYFYHIQNSLKTFFNKNTKFKKKNNFMSWC